VSENPEERIRSDRAARVEALRAAGVDPYPARADVREPVADVRARHEGLVPGADSGDRVRLAGRISGRRGHGKAMFLDLADRSGQLQLHATLDGLGEASYGGLQEIDLGDVVAVAGEVFCSRRGELSVRLDEWALLAKCLRPLPDKFHGLTDVELRLRRRYLDLLVNEESRQLAIARSRIVTAVRAALDGEGFLEVETPVLQPLYGGGAARPFTTHYNEYDRTYYLRIATELYLKRLIIGGLERVYELGKDFRNEGVSFKRSPEFTMVEWYEAYGDYQTAMAITERVTVAAAAAARSTVDVTPPWPRRTLREAITADAGIDPMADRDLERLLEHMRRDGLDVSADHTWAQAVDHLLSHYVEPQITVPVFLTDYPVELSPFAKRSPEHPELTERFEAFCAGMEFANGFSELNDPADQRERFRAARRDAAAGDEEAVPMDEDFLTALEYGMPPTAGCGIGIDRLAMVLTGTRSIREVILFPPTRDRGEQDA
jgi:lysyl-tRNA synthetase class 2